MALDELYSAKLKQNLESILDYESFQNRMAFQQTAQSALAVRATDDLAALYKLKPTGTAARRADWELQQAAVTKPFLIHGKLYMGVLVTVPVLHFSASPINRVPEEFVWQARDLGVKYQMLGRQSKLHFLPKPVSFDSLAELTLHEVHQLTQALFTKLALRQSIVPAALKQLHEAEELPGRRFRFSPSMITSFMLGVATVPVSEFGCDVLPEKMEYALRALDYRESDSNQSWCEKMSHHVAQPGREFPLGLAQHYEGLELGRLAEYRKEAANALLGLNNGSEREDYNVLALGPGSNQKQADMLVLSSDRGTVLNRVKLSLEGFTNQPLESFEMMLMDIAATRRVTWGGKLIE